MPLNVNETCYVVSFDAEVVHSIVQSTNGTVERSFFAPTSSAEINIFVCIAKFSIDVHVHKEDEACEHVHLEPTMQWTVKFDQDSETATIIDGSKKTIFRFQELRVTELFASQVTQHLRAIYGVGAEAPVPVLDPVNNFVVAHDDNDA